MKSEAKNFFMDPVEMLKRQQKQLISVSSWLHYNPVVHLPI